MLMTGMIPKSRGKIGGTASMCSMTGRDVAHQMGSSLLCSSSRYSIEADSDLERVVRRGNWVDRPAVYG